MSTSTIINSLNLSVPGTTASTSSTTGVILSSGGLGISLATNASSSTNGGSFTTAGGGAIALDLWVGGSSTTNIGAAAGTIDIGFSTSSTVQTGVMTGWTASTPSASFQLTGICFGTIFVAVATTSTSTGTTNIYTSTNGTSWSTATAPSTTIWSAVCWASDISTYVGVANGVSGTGSTAIMYSTTGTGSWTAATAPSTQQWVSVVRGTNVSANNNNVFVGVSIGLSGTSSASGSTAIMYNNVASGTWIAATAPSSLHWTSVCWSPALQIFLAVSTGLSAAQSTTVMYSSTGTGTWSSASCVAGKWSSVCWSPGLALFVAVSTDGLVQYSSNGTSWSSATASSAQQWTSVCWSPVWNLFVAVANNGTAAQQIMYSSTGSGTWSAATSSSATTWKSICFSNTTIELFVAVANTAVSGNSMYSTIPTGYNTTLSMGTLGTTATSIAGKIITLGNSGSSITIPGTTAIGGNTSITSGTASTSTTTGALVITGGLGVSSNIFCGNGRAYFVANTSQSIPATTPTTVLFPTQMYNTFGSNLTLGTSNSTFTNNSGQNMYLLVSYSMRVANVPSAVAEAWIGVNSQNGGTNAYLGHGLVTTASITNDLGVTGTSIVLLTNGQYLCISIYIGAGPLNISTNNSSSQSSITIYQLP